MTRSVKIRWLVPLFAAVAIALAACGSSSSNNSTSGGGSGGGSGSAAAALAKAKASLPASYAGTSRNVDPTSRPAAKGKSVIVISAGQAADSSSVPSDGAVDAAKAIGWKVQLYDAKLNPANYAPLVRQAIAAHPNGIILDAIDCDTVKQPLEEAKAAGIAVVGIYAFDCNDPHAGGAATGLFSAQINYGSAAKNVDTFTESYGADQANYIIAKSNNTAKIIAIQDPEFTVLYYTLQGFKDTIDASHGSQILDTLTVTTSDLTDGQIVPKIEAELQRFPQANWIKSPYTYVTTLGIGPALKNHSGHIDVMGGEGFAPELQLIRNGTITATNAISSDWTGWAAVDTMNSYFIHKAPVDSGIGWEIVDATHNLPTNPNANWTPPINYQAEYKKAWGVS